MELGVAGPRGAMHEGGADDSLCPDPVESSLAPTDRQRPALEIAQSLGDRVGVHRPDGRRDLWVREPVEEGDRLGRRERRGRSRPPAAASATRRCVRISPGARSPASTVPRSARGHLAGGRAARLPAQPVAGGLARSGVVLLTPVGDALEVVVLGPATILPMESTRASGRVGQLRADRPRVPGRRGPEGRPWARGDAGPGR